NRRTAKGWWRPTGAEMVLRRIRSRGADAGGTSPRLQRGSTRRSSACSARAWAIDVLGHAPEEAPEETGPRVLAPHRFARRITLALLDHLLDHVLQRMHLVHGDTSYCDSRRFSASST